VPDDHRDQRAENDRDRVREPQVGPAVVDHQNRRHDDRAVQGPINHSRPTRRPEHAAYRRHLLQPSIASLLLVQGGSLRRLAVGPRDCRYGDRVAAFSASGHRASVPRGTGEARARSPLRRRHTGAGSATTAQATAVPFAVALARTSNTGGRPAGNVSPDSGVDDILRTEHEITCRRPPSV
jgi:hypothetical protein